LTVDANRCKFFDCLLSLVAGGYRAGFQTDQSFGVRLSQKSSHVWDTISDYASTGELLGPIDFIFSSPMIVACQSHLCRSVARCGTRCTNQLNSGRTTVIATGRSIEADLPPRRNAHPVRPLRGYDTARVFNESQRLAKGSTYW
jgi:hypothetical protein